MEQSSPLAVSGHNSDDPLYQFRTLMSHIDQYGSFIVDSGQGSTLFAWTLARIGKNVPLVERKPLAPR
jgi:hypothetical protein